MSEIKKNLCTQTEFEKLLSKGQKKYEKLIFENLLRVSVSSFPLTDALVDYLTFFDCDFMEGVSTVGENRKIDITFFGCFFGTKTGFYATFKALGFNYCSFSEVEFYRSKVEDVEFARTHHCSKLNFFGTEISMLILSGNGKTGFDEIVFSKSNKIEKFQIFGHLAICRINFRTMLTNVWIGEGSYSLLTFPLSQVAGNITFSPKFDGEDFQKYPIKIADLDLGSTLITGHLRIDKSEIETIDLSGVRCVENASATFNDVLFTGNFLANETDFSKFALNQVSFHTYNVCFRNAIMLHLRFVNVQWPRDHFFQCWIKEEAEESVKNALGLKAYREIYRQLKQSSIDQGNKIDALQFYRNEMATLVQQFKTDKQSLTREQRWIVRIDGWASDFGQSWWRPLKRLAIIHLILFTILCLAGNVVPFRFELGAPVDWGVIDQMVGKFFDFALPTHKQTDTMNWFGKLLDILIRVSSAFFIYHIIRATRRFGMK